MNIREFIDNDQFAKLLGIELLEAADGRAKAKMEIKNEHLNAVGTAHGGAIFSLADLTLAAAANSRGNVAVAVNASISFYKPVLKGLLFAEAFENSANNKLGNYTINLTNPDGVLVASFIGMVYRKKEMLENLE